MIVFFIIKHMKNHILHEESYSSYDEEDKTTEVDTKHKNVNNHSTFHIYSEWFGYIL